MKGVVKDAFGMMLEVQPILQTGALRPHLPKSHRISICNEGISTLGFVPCFSFVGRIANKEVVVFSLQSRLGFVIVPDDRTRLDVEDLSFLPDPLLVAISLIG